LIFPNCNVIQSAVRRFLRCARPSIAAATLLLALSVAAPGAVAQTVTPQEVTPHAAASLLQTLEDTKSRERLLEHLRVLAATSKDAAADAPKESLGARVTALLITRIQAVGADLQGAIAVLADVPKLWDWVRTQATDATARKRWLGVLLWLIPVLGAGFAAEWLARALLARPRATVEDRVTESAPLRVTLLGVRSVLDLLPIAAFAAGAYGALPLTGAEGKVRLVVMILINANLLSRAILAAARMLLVPYVSSLRLLPLSDGTARYAYVWVRRFSNFAVYSFFALAAALQLGLAPAGHAGLAKAAGLVLATLAVIFILQNRRGVADWLRGDGKAQGAKNLAFRGLRNRFADVWQVLAILYVLVAFGIWALEIENGFAFVLRATLLSVGILLTAWGLLATLHRLIDRSFRVSPALKAGVPGLEERANRYFSVLHSVARYAVVIVAAAALLESWGGGTLAWITSELGQRIIASLMTIGLVVFGAILLAELVTSFVERKLAQSESKTGSAKARAKTLLPLFRMTVIVIVTIVATMIVLSELGLDIAPLLAGAGVIGLAVGFGAQTLVKDIITGLFILLEDQIAVGDVVRIGNHAGLVEGLSIRTIRLRDLGGNVHTIPFSSVDTVLNMTKDFSYALFEIGVAYREDIDAITPVLEEIGAEMQAEAAFADKILAPIEVLGLDRFDDSAVIIKARIKTEPLQQWAIGREFNRRMKRRFDELGIEIPFPHRTIYQGEATPVFKGLGRTPKTASPAKPGRKGGGRGDEDGGDGGDY